MTKEEAIKYLQQLYPNGGHCWLDEQRIEAIGMAVKALQEEPSKFGAAIQEGDDVRYNEDLGCRVNLSQLKRVAKKDSRYCMYSKDNYTDEDRKVLCGDCEEECELNKKEEPVSEDLGDYINELSKQFPEVSFAKLSRIAVSVAKWQKSNLLKHADGDDLPEIDREVIALEGIIDPTANDCFCGYKVVFAHRPTKEGYDGKSIATGVVEHYTPKTYGEGGWNIPNIVYWLDIELPKEIEL